MHEWNVLDFFCLTKFLWISSASILRIIKWRKTVYCVTHLAYTSMLNIRPNIPTNDFQIGKAQFWYENLKEKKLNEIEHFHKSNEMKKNKHISRRFGIPMASASVHLLNKLCVVAQSQLTYEKLHSKKCCKSESVNALWTAAANEKKKQRSFENNIKWANE